MRTGVRYHKSYSDRGKLSELSNRHEDQDIPPTEFELRAREMYNISQISNDKSLEESLGFITFANYSGDPNMLPLSVFRLREIVNDISSHKSAEISKMFNELKDIFPLPPEKPIKKKASVIYNIFRRIIV